MRLPENETSVFDKRLLYFSGDRVLLLHSYSMPLTQNDYESEFSVSASFLIAHLNLSGSRPLLNKLQAVHRRCEHHHPGPSITQRSLTDRREWVASEWQVVHPRAGISWSPGDSLNRFGHMAGQLARPRTFFVREGMLSHNPEEVTQVLLDENPAARAYVERHSILMRGNVAPTELLNAQTLVIRLEDMLKEILPYSAYCNLYEGPYQAAYSGGAGEEATIPAGRVLADALSVAFTHYAATIHDFNDWAEDGYEPNYEPTETQRAGGSSNISYSSPIETNAPSFLWHEEENEDDEAGGEEDALTNPSLASPYYEGEEEVTPEPAFHVSSNPDAFEGGTDFAGGDTNDQYVEGVIGEGEEEIIYESNNPQPIESYGEEGRDIRISSAVMQSLVEQYNDIIRREGIPTLSDDERDSLSLAYQAALFGSRPKKGKSTPSKSDSRDVTKIIRKPQRKIDLE